MSSKVWFLLPLPPRTAGSVWQALLERVAKLCSCNTQKWSHKTPQFITSNCKDITSHKKWVQGIHKLHRQLQAIHKLRKQLEWSREFHKQLQYFCDMQKQLQWTHKLQKWLQLFCRGLNSDHNEYKSCNSNHNETTSCESDCNILTSHNRKSKDSSKLWHQLQWYHELQRNCDGTVSHASDLKDTESC